MESNRNFVNINIKQLEGHLNTKQDWWCNFKYSLGYLMPSFKKTTMRFIKDVLSSKKELIKSADIIYVNVPNFPELSVANISDLIKNDEAVNKHLGIYEDIKELPDKHFFFGKLGIIKNEFITQLDYNQQNLRYTGQADEEQKEVIQINEELLKEIQSIFRYSKKK